MSLQVWLPLNGDLNNQGLQKYNISTLGTVSWPVSGKIGKCFQGGAGTQVANGLSIDNNLTDILNEDYSIAVWIKPLGNHIHYNGTVISSGNWNAKRWAFGVNQDNTKVDVLSNGHNVYINCQVPINTWTHLVCIRQSGVIKLYKNGVYVNSLTGTSASATLQSDATNTTIGRQTYANGYFSFNGCINDLRIYNNALSEEQIKKISQGLILHYPLNRRGWGQDNLLLNSNIEKSGKSNVAQWFRWNLNNLTLTTNTDYTLSFDAKMSNSDVFYIGLANNDSTQEVLAQGVSVTTEYKRYTFTKQTSKTNINSIIISNYKGYGRGNGNNTTGVLYVKNIKLEIGNKNTPWCPNSSETLYNTLGLNNNLQYDTSGYQNNGTKYNITYETDTPKYDVSSVFKSVDTSYIKVDDNKWMPQYQEAMTINLWAYSSNWSNTTKLFSCTESGGWNTESGNSGYIRFPIYVATNSAQTSYAYKYSSKELKISDLSTGWHMLTFIYDSTGNKVYVDGQLHSSYAFTSYGIRYNTNARLFLGCEANTASPYTPYFNGKLSDFRIYATVLSAEDVLSLYNNGAYIDQLNEIHGKVR